MWTTVAAAVVLPVAFYVGAHWGTNGIAAAWILIYPPLMVPLFARTFRRIDLKTLEFVSCILPSLVAAALMAAVVLTVGFLMPRWWMPWLRLTILVVLEAIAYVGALYAFYPERLRRVVQTLRMARGQQKTSAATPSAE
jgi:hypothetical protein